MTLNAEIFMFGFASSIHCAGMCGPLAACGGGGLLASSAYHGSRLLGYTLVGGFAGWAGSAWGQGPSPTTLAWISIGLAVVLLASALGHGVAVEVPWIQRHLHRGMRLVMKNGPVLRSAGIGLLTPLLPCGVLYAVVAAAVATGSPAGGSETCAWFALGSLPALAVVQANAEWLRRRFGAEGRRRVFRGLMVVGATILLARGALALTGSSCCS